MLADGSRSAEFLKLVLDRLWDAGLGFIKVNKGGAQQKAGIIDATVGRSERPCYEAPPTLGEGLRQTGRICQTRGSDKTPVDVDALRRADSLVVAGKVAEAKKAPAVQKLVRERKQEKVEELIAAGDTPEAAQRKVDAFHERGTAPLAYELEPFGQREVETLQVIDLIEDPARWDGLHMADPIEGSQYNSNIAVFYANSDSRELSAKINSFAHGQIVYDANRYAYGVEDAIEAVEDGLELSRVVKPWR